MKRPVSTLVNETPGLFVLLASTRGVELRFLNTLSQAVCRPPNFKLPIAAYPNVRESELQQLTGLKNVRGHFIPYEKLPSWVKGFPCSAAAFKRSADLYSQYPQEAEKVLAVLAEALA